ncbi:MAG: hypothetical protein ABI083_16145 [Lapillicoccus sp.]
MSPRHFAYAATLLLLAGSLGACGRTVAGGETGGTSAPTAIASALPMPQPSLSVAPLPTDSHGCAVLPQPSGPVTVCPTPAGAAPVTVTGVPKEGVEASCLLLGHYLLVGGTDAQRALLTTGRTAGTSVTVTGHTDTTQMSYCQQGTLLVVDDVTVGP